MIQFSPEFRDQLGKPAFAPGDIVHHRRYGYRGVVVDFDAQCKAKEDWYQSNQTQPSRDQAWYHVLVDGGTHTTYVAQQNLASDESEAPVYHPLVEYFFSEFKEGRYIRNERPWGSIDVA